MSRILDNEIGRMQQLIGYNVNEGKSSNSFGTVEYEMKAADGKTYGIVHEGTKYYIKVAPVKNTKVLAEDYDYIGGFNNKKAYEYSSYPIASKQFDLKMKSVNEACELNAMPVARKSSVKPSEWQVNETYEMRNEINRFNQLNENVSDIISKGYINEDFTMAHTLPEAPAKNPSSKKVNDPYTDTAVARGDKEFRTTSKRHDRVGPYDSDANSYRKALENGKKPNGPEGGFEDYEDARYVPKGAIADMHPSKKNHTVKLTEEQVLAWNRKADPNYTDRSNGTEIGDSDPYTEEFDGDLSEARCNNIACQGGEAVHNRDEKIWGKGHGTGDVTTELGDPFTEPVEESYILEVDDDENEPLDDDLKDNDPDSDFDNEQNVDDLTPNAEDIKDEDSPEMQKITSVKDDAAWQRLINSLHDDDDDGYYGESVSRNGLIFEVEMDGDGENPENMDGDMPENMDGEGEYYGVESFDDDVDEVPEGSNLSDDQIEHLGESLSRNSNIYEVTLKDFGKHPAYAKHPMTWTNAQGDTKWGRDWNDKSAKGEEPFGKKIGSFAPYDIIVDKVNDLVESKLFGKKKIY